MEVYSITCGWRDLIISDCNLTESSYTSDDIAPDGYIYEYTVIPRSNVEGATNGTSLTVTGMLILNYCTHQTKCDVLNLEESRMKTLCNSSATVEMSTVETEVKEASFCLWCIAGPIGWFTDNQ